MQDKAVVTISAGANLFSYESAADQFRRQTMTTSQYRRFAVTDGVAPTGTELGGGGGGGPPLGLLAVLFYYTSFSCCGKTITWGTHACQKLTKLHHLNAPTSPFMLALS